MWILYNSLQFFLLLLLLIFFGVRGGEEEEEKERVSFNCRDDTRFVGVDEDSLGSSKIFRHSFHEIQRYISYNAFQIGTKVV